MILMMIWTVSLGIFVVGGILMMDIMYELIDENSYAESIDKIAETEKTFNLYDDVKFKNGSSLDIYRNIKKVARTQNDSNILILTNNDGGNGYEIINIFSSFANNVLKVCSNPNMEIATKISEGTPLNFNTASNVVDYADKFDLDISLILGLIEIESDFKQYEVGLDQDRGYMQIIPSTEKWLVDEYEQLLGFEYDPSRIFEPEYNIGVGAVYLYHLKEKYGDNKDRILSEYNRGPYNLKKYYDRYSTYETNYSKTVKARSKKYIAYNKI